MLRRPTLAESLNGTFKDELVHRHIWRTREQVEFAGVEWIGWYNNRRLRSSIDDVPPAEFEANWREVNARATLSASHSRVSAEGGTSSAR